MWWNSNTYWGFHMIKSALNELNGEMLCESDCFVKKKMWYRFDYKTHKHYRSFSIRYSLLTILFHMCVMKCVIPTRNDFMTWNAFRITGLFMGICRSSEGFNAEFYVFIGVSLNKVQTVGMPVIWDVMMLVCRHCDDQYKDLELFLTVRTVIFKMNHDQ